MVKDHKKWSNENFISLMIKLNDKYPHIKLVVVGNKGDYKRYIKHIENTKAKFINTAGLTTISEVATLLKYSKLAISHDSGIMHLADALECRLITLFGFEYSASACKPLGTNSHILFAKHNKYAQKDWTKDIAINDVFDKINEVMGGGGVSNRLILFYLKIVLVGYILKHKAKY